MYREICRWHDDPIYVHSYRLDAEICVRCTLANLFHPSVKSEIEIRHRALIRDRVMFKLFYSAYKVYDTEVIVGCRPDTKKDLTSIGNVDAWISVTERFVPFLPGQQYFWFPWIESDGPRVGNWGRAGQPTHEMFYGALKVLSYLIEVQRVGRIYLHCDAGTHRAPTVFGAYLKGYIPDRYAHEIVAGVRMVEKDHNSDPLYYVDTYIQENPEFLEFFQWCAEHDTPLNYYFKEDLWKKELSA